MLHLSKDTKCMLVACNAKGLSLGRHLELDFSENRVISLNFSLTVVIVLIVY